MVSNWIKVVYGYQGNRDVHLGHLLRILSFFFLRFYLLIHERHRQREKQTPSRELDVGLDPGTPGSRPGLKAALNR